MFEVINRNVNVRSKNVKGGIRSSKNERNWKTCKLRMIKLIIKFKHSFVIFLLKIFGLIEICQD